MVNYTIGLVRRKGPIIFDRLIGKWVTENSQLSKTTTQTGCSGVPCAFIRIPGTFLLPCGGGLASALLLRVGETCFFIFFLRILPGMAKTTNARRKEWTYLLKVISISIMWK